MQAGKPLLSVLVPAFNVEKYISVCLRSLLLQTYTDVEILVCDDASTDKTWSKMQQFEDSRLSIFRNSSNLGKNKTSAFLLSKCKGEYVTVHDADDFSSSDRFENQMNFLLENCEYVMCGTNYISFLDSGKIVARSQLATDDETIRERITKESQFHGPTVVFKRSVISQVGGLYRYFTRAEDIDFTMRVAEKFKVCNLPYYYYFYRHQELSLTNHVKGYDVERLAHHKLLYYLASERKLNGGVDTLMQGDIQKIDTLVKEFEKEYENDPEVALRRGVFRLIEMQMFKNAVLLACLAVRKRFSLINSKCLLYALLTYFKGHFRLLVNKDRIDINYLK